MPVQLEFVEHVQDILKVVPSESDNDYECDVTILVRETGKNQEPWKLILIYQGAPPNITRYAAPRGALDWQKRIATYLTTLSAQPVETLIAGFPPSVQEGAASAITMMRASAVR